jgi:hypothetical protein
LYPVSPGHLPLASITLASQLANNLIVGSVFCFVFCLLVLATCSLQVLTGQGYLVLETEAPKKRVGLKADTAETKRASKKKARIAETFCELNPLVNHALPVQNVPQSFGFGFCGWQALARTSGTNFKLV